MNAKEKEIGRKRLDNSLLNNVEEERSEVLPPFS